MEFLRGKMVTQNDPPPAPMRQRGPSHKTVNCQW